MKSSIRRAIANVVAFGDTDIFPYPEDNLAMRDKPDSAVKICEDIHKDLDKALSTYPPEFYDAFVPNGYTGFRWATQIDAYWNVYLLSLVIEIGSEIEASRLEKEVVHSYRFVAGDSPELWDRSYGWRSFYERSRALSEDSKYVVISDVSEFYRRIYHHRLENALKHISDSDIPSRIMKVLNLYSRNTSYGLPVGGPAARLLSELVLNQIDHLLSTSGHRFCRFADDYVIITDNKTSAYDALIFLSEKLQVNQGLALQRSKTRILTSAEYRASQPLVADDESDTAELVAVEKRKLFAINLYYDPYSPTASEDYATLKDELSKLDIVFLLNHEIKKSRIHIPTINRIVGTLEHTSQSVRDEATMTIVTNLESFYPCLSAVLITLDRLFEQTSQVVQTAVVSAISLHLQSESYLLKTDAARSYAIRLIARSNESTIDPLLMSTFDDGGPIVRREALSAFARRNQWMVISDLKHRFAQMTPAERRAMISASYILGDEGRHWRGAVSKTFDPFERFFVEWMRDKSGAAPP